MLRTIHENGKMFMLVPGAQDVALYDAAKARGEESFPVSLFDAMDKGANPVAALREYRGWTAAVLAKKAGISSAYISQIESGIRTGSAKTLRAIANALGVDVDMLV